MMSTSQAEPVSGFGSFGFSPVLQRAVTAAGYTEPRPIQAQTMPAVLAGRDVLGLAQTGTGKTAAFALPILQRLLARPGRGPRVLVVAPTRELAIQIDADFRALGKETGLRTVTVYGGVSDRPQIQKLRRRPEIIIACPGRLLDLLGQGVVRLDLIETLVLDEADHMFDMGFLPDIRRILAALPEKRQNLLFAATMPSEVRKLAEDLLSNPMVAEFAHSRPARTIEHTLLPVAETRKLALLKHFLSEDGFVSAIVFTRTKHRAKRLALQIGKSGSKAVALQGNMSQGQRDRAMQGFRGRRFDVLVATDIAARGLDVDQVSHVINFDVPNTPEAYTHRVGRTGRSERSGKAYTFVTEHDRNVVHAIERKIGTTIPRQTVKGFEGVFLPPATEQRIRKPERRPGGSEARLGSKRRQHHRHGTGGKDLVGPPSRRSQTKRRRMARRSG